MFSNDLCRPIIFQFDKESSVKGVWGNRYTIDDMFFANSTINKDNWCFEAPKSWANPKSTERLQFPSGVYNMGLCKFNSSTFISQPHFLGADPFYINQFVEGSLNPDEAKHQTSIIIGMFHLVLKYRNNRGAYFTNFPLLDFIVIKRHILYHLEPQSGIPLEVMARFQANILVEASSGMMMFRNFKNPVFIPAFWFETKMSVPDELKLQMWVLSNLENIFRVAGYTLFGLGLGMITVTMVFYHAGIREISRRGPVYVDEHSSSSTVVKDDTVCSSIGQPTEYDESHEGNGDTVPILNK